MYRGHVVWCSNVSLSKTGFMMKHPGQTKITQFDILMFVKKDVGWFQISMQNRFSVLSSVAFFESQSRLYKNLPCKILVYIWAEYRGK